jgi:hypothetical protein
MRAKGRGHSMGYGWERCGPWPTTTSRSRKDVREREKGVPCPQSPSGFGCLRKLARLGFRRGWRRVLAVWHRRPMFAVFFLDHFHWSSINVHALPCRPPLERRRHRDSPSKHILAPERGSSRPLPANLPSSLVMSTAARRRLMRDFKVGANPEAHGPACAGRRS